MQFCRVDEGIHPTPQPIEDLPCVDGAQDGEHAVPDIAAREIFFDKCPRNTFSVGGGGILIDGKMGAFGYRRDDGFSMPLEMESSCQIKAMKSEDDAREYKLN